MDFDDLFRVENIQGCLSLDERNDQISFLSTSEPNVIHRCLIVNSLSLMIFVERSGLFDAIVDSFHYF